MGVAKRVLLVVMGVFYVAAGINHFLSEELYLRIMPPYLPWHRELVWLSGVAEVALGLGVLLPRTRRLAAWGIIALLVAVFPANVHQAVNDVPLREGVPGPGIWAWLRLPLQGVLIAWAWWYTREDAGEGARFRG